MAAAETGYRDIEANERGVLMVAGTGYKVIPLIEQYKAWKWSSEEFRENYPDLTMAQVHSVLAYYHDHVAEIDREIDRRSRYAEQMRHEEKSSPPLRRLRALRTKGVV